MIEILTLAARADAGLDLERIALGAPGLTRPPIVLGKERLAVVEAHISRTPNDLDDLEAWLKASVESAPVDWARRRGGMRRKRLLISDMDSTIIGQECLDELADFAGLKAEVSAITERAMRGELNFETALSERVAMLKGLGLDALEKCYAERVRLNPGARTLVATMKAHGARCVLVSGGFRFFTSRVAAECGFDAERGNTLVDDGRELTGQVGQPILGREAKLLALNQETAAQGLAPADAVAMGDGANDLAMIKASGLGIAYRAKPIVAAEAHARIEHTDLTAALFFQGYSEGEIVWLG
jgi:phosphoserine phosphatase